MNQILKSIPEGGGVQEYAPTLVKIGDSNSLSNIRDSSSLTSSSLSSKSEKSKGDRSSSSTKPRTVFVHVLDSTGCRDCSSDDDDYVKLQPSDPTSETPAEYWHVQKLIKYIKTGDQTATTVCLACLADCDLKDPWIQLAFRDIGGFEILVNLLESKHHQCTEWSLKLLCSLAGHSEIQRTIIELGIIPNLVSFLQSGARNIQAMSAYIISKLTKMKKGRHTFHSCDGLPLLISLLEVPEKRLMKTADQLDKDEEEEMWAVNCSAKALFELSACNKVKRDLYTLGIIKIISRLLKAKDDKTVECTMGILQNCAAEKIYQKAIESEDMIESILKNLDESNNIRTRELCLRAIFRSCEGAIPRRLVYTHHGTDKLADLLIKNPEKILLVSLTGAIWKTSVFEDNVIEFNKKKVIPKLVQLFRQEEQDEEVLINTAGALGEMARMPENRKAIQMAGGIQPAARYLTRTNPELLQNVTFLLGECANELECMEEMEQYDSVRLIWSLLINPDSKVKASACWALVPCIRNARDSGELVRSLVGALELVVKLLYESDNHLLGAVCAAISEVATDQENLAVITEHGVVPLLANLCARTDEFLMTHLASAIGSCCECRNNCHQFGQLGVVEPLVNHIKNAESITAVTTSVGALCALSKDPFNCIVMHRNRAVPLLLQAVESSHRPLQEAAAGCLYNLRTLALHGDRVKYKVDN